MKVNFKLFIVLDIIAWCGLATYLVAGELLLITEKTLMIFGALAILFVLGIHIYLFCALKSNSKRIELLKQQYVESIKPATPLRFCPADEELVRMFKKPEIKNEKVETAKEQTENTEEKTLVEEEFELT